MNDETLLKYSRRVAMIMLWSPAIVLGIAVFMIKSLEARHDAELTVLYQDVATLRSSVATLTSEVELLKKKPVLMKSTWYGNYPKGRRTADGKLFNKRAMTCAHRTLPIGAFLHLELNGREAIVEVTDRGPEKSTGHDIDVTEKVAEVLGFKKEGLATLTVRRLS